MKTKKGWACIHLNLTIQSDENGNIFDININNGYRSVSYETLPSLKEILEDFDDDNY